MAKQQVSNKVKNAEKKTKRGIKPGDKVVTRKKASKPKTATTGLVSVQSFKPKWAEAMLTPVQQAVHKSKTLAVTSTSDVSNAPMNPTEKRELQAEMARDMLRNGEDWTGIRALFGESLRFAEMMLDMYPSLAVSPHEKRTSKGACKARRFIVSAM